MKKYCFTLHLDVTARGTIKLAPGKRGVVGRTVFFYSDVSCKNSVDLFLTVSFSSSKLSIYELNFSLSTFFFVLPLMTYLFNQQYTDVH